ncbi:MAG: MFS transporter [Firmicutes bacterium]|nr:MFS transporter [Bacillota bacterium]HOB35753.1 MFS transporter [Bacillota bacterium]HPZ89943.1 MFS transporter [Bacillota bacterium]HQE01349.1 MFS transporter [Bacillota bacterium]
MTALGKPRMTTRDKVTLAILVLMSVFLYADMNAITPVVTDIMAEYGINETDIGLVGSAFTLIGAIVSIVFGFLADRTSRKWLLAFVVLVGEIPCFLTGVKFFTQTYEQLLLLRILTGLGVGGIFPITFSLIGDYFHAHHRPMASAFVGAAWGIGEIAGSLIAGYLAEPFGWRLPFMVAAAPNFLLVPLFLLIAREPARGAQEEQVQELMAQGIEYKEKIRLSDLKYVLTNKTNVLGYLQGIPGSLPWGILPFYLIAYYEVVQGFSKEMGTTIFFLFGVGATIGGILGGWLGQVVYKKDPRYMPLLAGGTVLAGIIPTLFLLNITWPTNPGLTDWLLPVAFAVFSGALITIAGPNIKSILLNVNPPEHRGTVFALHNIFDSIGKGVGPFIGGLLITNFGYVFTVYFSALMWIPCGLLFLAIYWTIKKDIEYVNRYLDEKAARLAG